MLTDISYTARARNAGLNVYFIAEADRKGRVRREENVPANPCCNCYSVAKAFTVTAVGMLYDRGLLTPETRVEEILPIPETADKKWHRVTIDHLLRHTAGFGTAGLLDIDCDDASSYSSSDYLSLVFAAKLDHEPGEIRCYTDGAYYLLSRIVAQVAGVDPAGLLRPVLMGTLGFKEFAWSVCPQGYAMGATGLYLRTEDMVKLGVLYLNRGMWNGQRILSKEWVRLVLERGYEFTDRGNGWVGKGGMRGQMLAFHMEKGLAVAWHSFEKKVPFEVMIHD
jgi:CubicO group peptidase (beta-lactamase class C family)